MIEPMPSAGASTTSYSRSSSTVSRFVVYGLTDPITSEVRYIGKSSNGLRRPMAHGRPSSLASDRTRKANWIRGLRSLGLDYGIRVLEEVAERDLLCSVECFWIAQARGLGWRLTNLTDGGDGMSGHSWTPASRAKLSRSMKGRKLTQEHVAKLRFANTGRRHSDATREKLREASKGRTLSAETRAKMSLARTGKTRSPFSQEWRAKIAASLRGRRQSPAHVAAAAAGRTGSTRSPETRARISTGIKAAWSRKRLHRACELIASSSVGWD
ncbi:NUMOD3 domain-containing DNA-binding protein [Myxococcus sp. CA033]|uniref:NUMOD3 domain-containing DNA-binding protein n=1 Tax=Myxococcus sp. CA033 TaxID=2741516 RepID=UPI00352CD7D3